MAKKTPFPENYILDNVEYNFLPVGKNCKNFSVYTRFICFPKKFTKNFEKLLFKQQIFINKFICLNYLKSFEFVNNQINYFNNYQQLTLLTQSFITFYKKGDTNYKLLSFCNKNFKNSSKKRIKNSLISLNSIRIKTLS